MVDEDGYSQSPEKSSPREEQATLSSAESIGPVCARKQPRRKRKKRRGGEGELGQGKEGGGGGRRGEGKSKDFAIFITSVSSCHSIN